MRIIDTLLLFLLLGQTGSAPSPVHTVYDDSMKSTEIKTNWLYVLNNPDQFLQLKLVGRFRGKQMPKTGPSFLQIEVISQSPNYKYVTPPELIAIADGVELKIGKMEQHPNQALMGMFKGGQKAGQSMANKVSPVPVSAAVLTQHKLEDLAAEWIVVNVSWEALSALSKASKIDWKLGDTGFSFIEIQVTRLKQFVAAVTPESGVVVLDKSPTSEKLIDDKPTRTDTPSDANNTSLKDTLDWLKRQISKYAAAEMSTTGEPLALTLTKFNSCNIEWRLAPQAVNLDVPGRPRRFPALALIYVTSLKDLEPGSVQVTKSGDSLRFSTRKREQLIQLTYRDDNAGQVNGFMTPRPFDSAAFSLKKNDLGPEMREAFSHAIKLCQADAKSK